MIIKTKITESIQRFCVKLYVASCFWMQLNVVMLLLLLLLIGRSFSRGEWWNERNTKIAFPLHLLSNKWIWSNLFAKCVDKYELEYERLFLISFTAHWITARSVSIGVEQHGFVHSLPERRFYSRLTVFNEVQCTRCVITMCISWVAAVCIMQFENCQFHLRFGSKYTQLHCTMGFAMCIIQITCVLWYA